MAEDVPLTKLDTKGDSRIIPLGSFIRGCYLDELPQLINVLRGDMSLIGPRPSLAFEASQYGLWQRMRSATFPGMTGLWQVSGKNKTTFKEMLRPPYGSLRANGCPHTAKRADRFTVRRARTFRLCLGFARFARMTARRRLIANPSVKLDAFGMNSDS